MKDLVEALRLELMQLKATPAMSSLHWLFVALDHYVPPADEDDVALLKKTLDGAVAQLRDLRDTEGATRCQFEALALLSRIRGEHRSSPRLDDAAREYERLRRTLPSGGERTKLMDELVAQVIERVTQQPMEDAEIEIKFKKGLPGDRVVALAAAIAHPTPVLLRMTLQAVNSPLSPFEQFTALRSLGRMLPTCLPDELEQIRTALEGRRADRSRSGIPKTDRSRWGLSGEILSRIARRPVDVFERGILLLTPELSIFTAATNQMMHARPSPASRSLAVGELHLHLRESVPVGIALLSGAQSKAISSLTKVFPARTVVFVCFAEPLARSISDSHVIVPSSVLIPRTRSSPKRPISIDSISTPAEIMSAAQKVAEVSAIPNYDDASERTIRVHVAPISVGPDYSGAACAFAPGCSEFVTWGLDNAKLRSFIVCEARKRTESRAGFDYGGNNAVEILIDILNRLSRPPSNQPSERSH